MAANDKLRVLLVADQTLFRKGIASLLSSRQGVEVIGEASDMSEALEHARHGMPDLILIDVHAPFAENIGTVYTLKQVLPRVKVVVLSAFDDNADLFTAVRLGADGFLLRNVEPTEFFALVEGVGLGAAPISAALSERILHEFRRMDLETRPALEAHVGLTPKEVEMLELLARGDSNRVIADRMHISENTVKLHVHNAMEKLHLQNRTQLAVYLVRRRLAQSDTPG
jgi:two-component system NarL family response regulator